MLYPQQNDTTSFKITRQNHTLKILGKVYPLYDQSKFIAKSIHEVLCMLVILST